MARALALSLPQHLGRGGRQIKAAQHVGPTALVMAVPDTAIHSAGPSVRCGAGGMDPGIKCRGDGECGNHR